MKKLGLFLLAGVVAAILLTGCGENTTDPTKSNEADSIAETTTEAATETEVEFNTVDNNTSEEVPDLETGANLRETPEPDTEDEGVVPDENEQPYIEDDPGVIPEDTVPVDEGGEPDPSQV